MNLKNLNLRMFLFEILITYRLIFHYIASGMSQNDHVEISIAF